MRRGQKGKEDKGGVKEKQKTGEFRREEVERENGKERGVKGRREVEKRLEMRKRDNAEGQKDIGEGEMKGERRIKEGGKGRN